MQPIKNVEALHAAIAAGQHYFLILLQGGGCSRKTITLSSHGRFKVINHIDENVQRLTPFQLCTRSNIGEAMKAGAFMAESPEDYQQFPN